MNNKLNNLLYKIQEEDFISYCKKNFQLKDYSDYKYKFSYVALGQINNNIIIPKFDRGVGMTTFLLHLAQYYADRCKQKVIFIQQNEILARMNYYFLKLNTSKNYFRIGKNLNIISYNSKEKLRGDQFSVVICDELQNDEQLLAIKPYGAFPWVKKSIFVHKRY